MLPWVFWSKAKDSIVASIIVECVPFQLVIRTRDCIKISFRYIFVYEPVFIIATINMNSFRDQVALCFVKMDLPPIVVFNHGHIDFITSVLWHDVRVDCLSGDAFGTILGDYDEILVLRRWVQIK